VLAGAAGRAVVVGSRARTTRVVMLIAFAIITSLLVRAALMAARGLFGILV
jgi:hypothetical protein